jgi:protein SCO1/2
LRSGLREHSGRWAKARVPLLGGALALLLGCSSDPIEPLRAPAVSSIAAAGNAAIEGRGETGKRSDLFSDILLYDQHGEPVRFYTDLVKDKVVLLNLMYTTCPKICPANTAQLARIHDHLAPWIGRDITMVSLSIDPDVDTPERLKRYWQVFGSRPGWRFLTGDYDEIERLRRQLGVYDLDPVIDADKTSHSGIVTFGNDRTNRWSALPVMTKAQQVAETILRITWDDRWRGRLGRVREAIAPAAYRGRGVVKQLDDGAGRVVIEHQDIPGLMMAMTMPFEVADRALLAGVGVEDAVSFRVVARDGGRYRIQSLDLEGKPNSLRRGAEHYAAYCASCHGSSGDGDGPLAATLDPRPARHSDRNRMAALSDGDLFRVIKEGGPAIGKSPQMAAWGGSLSDDSIGDLVAYVRTLGD